MRHSRGRHRGGKKYGHGRKGKGRSIRTYRMKRGGIKM